MYCEALTPADISCENLEYCGWDGGMVGGNGKVVPPASQVPGTPEGGGVLHAAVSAKDQIFGFEDWRTTEQSP